MNRALPEEAQFVTVLKPAADAAGRNGVAFSVKHGHKVTLVCLVDQGNAAQVTFTPQQCTDVAGTGAKAIAVVPVYANLDESVTTAVARAADALSYQTDVALKPKKVLFDIDPSKMDLDGGFDCLRCNTNASNAANITAIIAIIWPLRHAGQSLPNAMAN
jgi:hypothetical protein